MKKIILSGFRTFGDYLENSTEVVAGGLHGEQVSGFTIHSAVFDANIPEDWENRGRALFSMASSLHASAIVALGMASEKTGLCVERMAANKVHNLKYCPRESGRAVDTNRRYKERMQLDLRPWNLDDFKKTCGEKGIPVMKDSKDAGGFCCNHLAYQARVAQLSSDRWTDIPFIFIHIPCSPECVSDQEAFRAAGKVTIPTERIVAGLEILLANLYDTQSS